VSAHPVTPKPSRWPWSRRARPPKHRDPLDRLEQFDALAAPVATHAGEVEPGASVSTASPAGPVAAPPRPRRPPAPTDDAPAEPPVEAASLDDSSAEAAVVVEDEVVADEVVAAAVVETVATEDVATELTAGEQSTHGAGAGATPRRRGWGRRRGDTEQLDLGLDAQHRERRRGRRRARPAEPDHAAPPTPATEARPEPPTPSEPDVEVGAGQLVFQSGADRAHALTAPSTISSGDLVNEAIAGLFSRPSRTLLTVLGTMIGLTALVATLGLSRTAGNQIVGRFDEIAATEVDVSPRPIDLTDQPNDLPWDAAARLERLNGVVAAGSMAKVDVGKALVGTTPVIDPQRNTDFKLGVQAMSPSMFRAVRAQLRAGRYFDEGHSARADRVAVLGASAAEQLGIRDLSALPAIQIGDQPFLVIGIVNDVARVDKLMSSVMIPEGTARQLYNLRVPDIVVIETKIGANRLIADQAPIALRPDNPDGLKVTAQPELTQVRESVSGDLDLLFLMLGAVSLLVGAIGIANVTLVSVMERTGEIGLRRALGATRRHVAMQFLVESTAMGFVGGILGASLGIVIVVAVSAFQGWTPVIDAYIPFVAPIIGGVIGLVAGSYPARRAASLEPVEALRSGT